MKYRNLVVAALISVLSVACSKENVEEPTNNKVSNTTVEYLQNSKSRGQDDEILVAGVVKMNHGQEVLQEGQIQILDSITNEWVKTVYTNNAGQFEAHVLGGSYVLECYKEGSFVGKSEEINAFEDLRVVVDL